MKCRWKFIPPAATAAGNGHKSSVGSCLHRYFVIFYFLSPEFDGNKQGGDENDSFRLRERRRKRERERERFTTCYVSCLGPSSPRERGGRACAPGSSRKPPSARAGLFFCFVFLQIFPFTHTQHIKVFPSRRTKNYFENKKKKKNSEILLPPIDFRGP